VKSSIFILRVQDKDLRGSRTSRHEKVTTAWRGVVAERSPFETKERFYIATSGWRDQQVL